MRWIPFLLITLLFSCTPLKRDCKAFKTGTFSFETLQDGQLITTTFTRNDTLEVAMVNGRPDSSDVRWINDCEYIVSKRNPKNRAEKQAVHMKVLYTEANSYTFEYSLVGKPRKEKGSVSKLKD
ncbi:DNA topoisomerase IV [Dokdonia sinensis]|uniref:DNA topoisomerase IV n=1 Tax=Dokdonia sinensis TaxID=2479847 RepID=A0A3M0FY09_9FLAO|nr:DNA topoisomerase IV [Dokdonia sinensis]RMB57564.1 DNA topoisomerase IV [Dokdonia sinensis]